MDNEFEKFFRQAQKVRLNEMEEETCKNHIFQEIQKIPVRLPKEACLTEYMTPFSPTQLAAAQSIILSEAETARAEKTLQAFMKGHPVDMVKAIQKKESRSPLFAGVSSLFSVRYRPVFAAVLILVLGTGSLSYAAESALPGDTLYGIKVHVEEVRATVAVSADAKAEWEAERANRRIQEAERLADKGKLTAEVNTKLMIAFSTHVQKSQQNVKVVAESGNRERASSLNKSMEAKLRDRALALNARLEKQSAAANTDVTLVLQTVQRATDDTIAFEGTTNGQIALETGIPQFVMQAQGESTARQNAESSSSIARTLIAKEIPPATDTSMLKQSDDGQNDGQSRQDTIQMQQQMNTSIQVETMGLMKMSDNGTHSSYSSGTGSSSVKIRSSSSAAVDINISSATGTPVEVEVQQDGSIKVNIDTKEEIKNELLKY